MIWSALTPAEDQLVWAMRAEGMPFAVIEAEIEARRAKVARQRCGRATAWAVLWRERYRAERGLA